MKNVLVLYDKSHKDFSNVSESILKNNIQKHFAHEDVFIIPHVIGVKDLFQTMEYFPPFMQKYVFSLPATVHHYCCEFYTFLYDRFSYKKRTTPKTVNVIIEEYCRNFDSNQVIILQTSRYDYDYHDQFVKLHLNFLFLDFPELKKLKYKTIILDKNFEVEKVYDK